MPKSRKNRKSPKNRKSRKSGGGFGYEPGAYPFQAGMGAASTQSLLQGAGFEAAHVKQHGGASAYMAPGGMTTLPSGTGMPSMPSGTGMPSMPSGTGMPAMPSGTGMPSMPAMPSGTGMPSMPAMPSGTGMTGTKGGRRRRSSRQKGGVAPIGDSTMLLEGSARENAMVAGYDAHFRDISGMQDGGRRRRRRKGSRKGRKGSRKGSRRKRGGALSGSPLGGNADVSSFYGSAGGPKMLLNDYSGAGLNPDWKSVSSYTPRP